jgi:hypothetical protein
MIAAISAAAPSALFSSPVNTPRLSEPVSTKADHPEIA